jgi:hypothetical protein
MKFDFRDQIKQKTNDELNEIFINAKDYNPDFVRLAEQELKDRNIDIDASKQIRVQATEQATAQLKEGKEGSPLYILVCFVLAFLGGLIAIYAGYIYSQSKIKSPDGELFYVYNEQTRQLGKIMMGLGTVVFLFLLLRSILKT